MELTVEQLNAAESMPLEDLKALILKETEGGTPTSNGSTDPVVTAEPVMPARDANGRFVAADADGREDPVDGGEPATTIYRKEIANGDGSVDVYEADSLEDLVEKLALGKLNANKKIQEFIKEKKSQTAQAAQVSADDEYVVGEKLKKSPKQTVEEIVLETLTKQQTKLQQAKDAQERFVATHPDYIANPENGNRLVAWLRANGHTEISSQALEQGYQDLKSSGLLKLKTEGASDDAGNAPTATEQTVQPEASTTQQRSPRRGSTVSVRTGARAATTVSTEPSEDELYKMPLHELEALANKQLAANRN